MRTNLSTLKTELFNGIINARIKEIVGTSVNHKEFLLMILPMDFLSHKVNESLLTTRNNNSSRLSNIFKRATEEKRKESRFRARFMSSFTVPFFKEMLSNASFMLRGYNKDFFDSYIESILTEDEFKSTRLSQLVKENYAKEPTLAITIVFLYAFHLENVDDFRNVILEAIKPATNTDAPIDLLIKKYNLNYDHVYDYLYIAFNHGMTDTIAATKLLEYAETHSEVNPLIHNELGNILFYGHHFTAADKRKSLKYYSDAADKGFGLAEWTIGILTSNEKHRLKYNRMPIVMNYYDKAISHGHKVPLNNIAVHGHRALQYYITSKTGKDLPDAYKFESRKDVLEIYQDFKDRDFFKGWVKLLNLDEINEENFESLFLAERAIINDYLLPSYESGYFFAMGSIVIILRNQLALLEQYNQKTSQWYEEIYKHMVESTELFAITPLAESYYYYGLMLEDKGKEFYQPAYEYYYSGYFDVPQNDYQYPILMKFLLLHHHPLVPYKKNIPNIRDLFLLTFNNHIPRYGMKEQLLLKVVALFDSVFSLEELSKHTKFQLKNHLILEGEQWQEDQVEYNKYIQTL